MELKLLKCHGSGNDFILIDETSFDTDWISEPDRRALTQSLCNRNSGIGSDGILFYQPSATADCRMSMFNPDGTEAEMCGNGIRCIGRYCVEKLMKDTVTVETMKVVLTVKRGDPIHEGIDTYEAEIGPISLLPSSLPMDVATDTFIGKHIPELSDDLSFTALSIPNPHIVTIVNEIDRKVVSQCGIKANDVSVFPNGVNVSFVKALGKNKIFVITCERGVGITDSCGTAMSSSAYVSALHNVCTHEESIYVFNKGGMVVCDVPDPKTTDDSITLKGNATFVFEATVIMSNDYTAICKQDIGAMRLDEISAYEKLQQYAQSIRGNRA